ncbi:heterokaryon incompatibility protein [Rutstroemia sp. NJR-2017a BBW]|nr:heterokaryon incompatibility protein [Rutstroemia sp. NJR-2017a BBW]
MYLLVSRSIIDRLDFEYAVRFSRTVACKRSTESLSASKLNRSAPRFGQTSSPNINHYYHAPLKIVHSPARSTSDPLSVTETKLTDTIQDTLCIDTLHCRILLRISKSSRATTARPSEFTTSWSKLVYVCASFKSCQGISDGTFKGTNIHKPVTTRVGNGNPTDLSRLLPKDPPRKALASRKKLDSIGKNGRTSKRVYRAIILAHNAINSTRSKQTTSTTDSGFQDVTFQNGVLNPNYSKPPANLVSLQERIDRSRATASPSESEYQYFASSIRRAPNEASVIYESSVALLQRYGEPGYHKSYNQAFSNFPKNVGFKNDLSAAQPDMAEGLNLTQFDPFPAREQLGGAATVYTGPEATTLPHLAGEWKGPGKDMILAQTQAAYDGACMVYGRNKARSFLKNPDPAGHTLVSTFTTDGTILNTFAHYSSETQGQLKYHQSPASSSKLRDELNKKWSEKQWLDEDKDEMYEDSCESVLASGSACRPADCNNEDNPTNQLLTEYWMSLSENNQDDPSPEALITPPQSSNDTLRLLEPNEDIDDSNVYSYRRIRQRRTRAADPVEWLREVDHESNVRRTGRKRNHQG